MSGRAVVGGLLVAGCGGSVDADVVWWRIEVGTALVGTDRHVRDGEGELVSTRTYRYRAGDRVVTHRVESRWTVVDGRVRSHVSPAREVSFSETEAPWWWLAPPPLGAQGVYDPATGGIAPGPVEGDAARRRLGTWWAEVGADGVTAYGIGPVRGVRVDGPPEAWSPIDPAVALGWETGPLAGRRRVVLDVAGVDPAWFVRPRQRWTPEGLVVEAPLAAEVPASAREAIRRAIGRVQDRLAYAPTPGEGGLVFGVRGDCTEFAAAFVDEIDRPARRVIGWVHVEREGGRFVPHAWAEVDTGVPAGWVPVDPTLGQVIADGAHVGLSEPWSDRPWEALVVAAGARVRVVDARD